MTLAKFIWHKARRINRLPGAYSLFYIIANKIYRDGDTITLRRGPAAGLRWRHYHCYQPWMAFGLYEPEVAQLIYSSLKPGDIFFDIGANAGYFTLVAAQAIGQSGKVVAFDPVPQNVETIKEQINQNKLQDRCIVESVAISDFNGMVRFLVPAKNANAHLADVEAPHISDTGGDFIEVTSIKLDSYVLKNIYPAFIKMDIEGAEVKALKGAVQLMANPKAPIFLITAHSHDLGEQVKNILSQAGYKFTNFEHMIHAIPNRLVDQYKSQKYRLIE